MQWKTSLVPMKNPPLRGGFLATWISVQDLFGDLFALETSLVPMKNSPCGARFLQLQLGVQDPLGDLSRGGKGVLGNWRFAHFGLGCLNCFFFSHFEFFFLCGFCFFLFRHLPDHWTIVEVLNLIVTIAVYNVGLRVLGVDGMEPLGPR